MNEPTECPKCQGSVWDNRARKASGKMSAKAPDFSCKDKDGCGWVQWPPRGQQAPSGAAKGPSAPAPKLSGPERKERRDLNALFYRHLIEQTATAMKATADKHKIPLTMADVQAATFSQFNVFKDRGWLPEPDAKPEPPKRLPSPPPRRPEPEPEFEEPPPGWEPQDDDIGSLPF